MANLMDYLKNFRLKINRPILLAIDMDGVLADFDEEMRLRLSKRGHHFDTTREMFLELRKNEALRKIHKEIYHEANFYKDMLTIEGAVEAYHELDKMTDMNGQKLFKLYILTAPSLNNPTCASDKTNDIIKWFGREAAERLVLSPDKTLIHVDILIDDRLNVSGIFGSSEFPRSNDLSNSTEIDPAKRNDMSFEHIRFHTPMYDYDNPKFHLINDWSPDPIKGSYIDVIVSACIKMNLLEFCEVMQNEMA